jgi:hypothetical protein
MHYAQGTGADQWLPEALEDGFDDPLGFEDRRGRRMEGTREMSFFTKATAPVVR